LAAVCNNRIPEVPFRSWRCELREPAFSQVKGNQSDPRLTCGVSVLAASI
jgi:hypothetical protein